MKVVVLVLALVAAVVAWRRRRPREHVEVAFDDGSVVRVERGPEAADLLDDAREVARILGS